MKVLESAVKHLGQPQGTLISHEILWPASIYLGKHQGIWIIHKTLGKESKYSTWVSHETFGPSLMYLCHPQTVGSAISYLGQSHGSRVSFKVLGSAIKQLGHP